MVLVLVVVMGVDDFLVAGFYVGDVLRCDRVYVAVLQDLFLVEGLSFYC